MRRPLAPSGYRHSSRPKNDETSKKFRELQVIMRRGKVQKITESKGEIRARVRSPGSFKKGSFRRIDVGRKGYTGVVVGTDKRTGKRKIQAYRYSKKDFGRKGAIQAAERQMEKEVK